MTLGEKVSNIVGWITDSLTGSEGGYDESDNAFTFGEQEDMNESYSYEGSAVRKPERFSTRTESRETNVVKHPGYKGHEVRIIEPRSFGDTTQIVKQLLDQDRKSVV